MKLIERLTKLYSFAIERSDGQIAFVEAHDFTVDAEGRLAFRRRWSGNVAAYQAGAWVRVMRDLTLEDIGGEVD